MMTAAAEEQFSGEGGAEPEECLATEISISFILYLVNGL